MGRERKGRYSTDPRLLRVQISQVVHADKAIAPRTKICPTVQNDHIRAEDSHSIARAGTVSADSVLTVQQRHLWLIRGLWFACTSCINQAVLILMRGVLLLVFITEKQSVGFLSGSVCKGAHHKNGQGPTVASSRMM